MVDVLKRGTAAELREELLTWSLATFLAQRVARRKSWRGEPARADGIWWVFWPRPTSSSRRTKTKPWATGTRQTHLRRWHHFVVRPARESGEAVRPEEPNFQNLTVKLVDEILVQDQFSRDNVVVITSEPRRESSALDGSVIYLPVDAGVVRTREGLANCLAVVNNVDQNTADSVATESAVRGSSTARNTRACSSCAETFLTMGIAIAMNTEGRRCHQ